MEAIRAYSTEPGFTDPVDKWSFAIKQTEWDDVSAGISGDFGLGIFNSTNDLRVSYVEPASPAAGAGIARVGASYLLMEMKPLIQKMKPLTGFPRPYTAVLLPHLFSGGRMIPIHPLHLRRQHIPLSLSCSIRYIQ